MIHYNNYIIVVTHAQNASFKRSRSKQKGEAVQPRKLRPGLGSDLVSVTLTTLYIQLVTFRVHQKPPSNIATTAVDPVENVYLHSKKPIKCIIVMIT